MNVQTRLPILLVTLFLLSLTGCGWFGSKKIVIDEAIKALESRRGELIAMNKAVEKADFYPDESGSGIVIEYTFNRAAIINDSFNSESVKKEQIAKFKDNDGIKTILDHDVFIRFLFKSPEGKVLADSKIEKSDL